MRSDSDVAYKVKPLVNCTLDLRIDSTGRCWTREYLIAPSLFQLVSLEQFVELQHGDIVEVSPAIDESGHTSTRCSIIRVREDKKLPNTLLECLTVMRVIIDESHITSHPKVQRSLSQLIDRIDELQSSIMLWCEVALKHTTQDRVCLLRTDSHRCVLAMINLGCFKLMVSTSTFASRVAIEHKCLESMPSMTMRDPTMKSWSREELRVMFTHDEEVVSSYHSNLIGCYLVEFAPS